MRGQLRHQGGYCENGQYLAKQPFEIKIQHTVTPLKGETTMLRDSLEAIHRRT